MDLQNASGKFLVLTKLGVDLANGDTATGIEDKWIQDPDIAALVTAGSLVATNFDTDAGSKVAQAELAAALVTAGGYTATNAGDWDTAVPTTIGDALDRIAAQVAINAAVPIP